MRQEVAMKKREVVAMPKRAPARLIALSDGLFATVLTLLVLDLRAPLTANGQASDMLTFIKAVGPHFFSYLLTFIVAGVYWLAHHRNFDHVVDYDRGLLGYNLLFLLFIGLLPFTTAAISSDGFQPGSYPLYWAIYASNLVLAGLILNLCWVYAVAHGQVDASVTPTQSRHLMIRQLVTPAVFLLSIVVQLLFPRDFLGPAVLLLIPLAQRLSDHWFPSAVTDSAAGPRGFSRTLWRLGAMAIWLSLIALAIWMTTR
jgi:uncharacterized membrane protein